MEENKKDDLSGNSVNPEENLPTVEKKPRKKASFILITIVLILVLAFGTFAGVNYIKYKSFSKNIYEQDAALLKEESETASITSKLSYKDFNTKANKIIESRNKLIQDVESQKIILFNSKLQLIKFALGRKNEQFKSELMNNSEYALQATAVNLYTKMGNKYKWYSKEELQKKSSMFLLLLGLNKEEVAKLKDGYLYSRSVPESKRISLTLTNNSNREFSNIMVELAVYKGTNNQVDTFKINVGNLQPHKTTEIDNLFPVNLWYTIGFEKNVLYWGVQIGDINFVGDKDCPPYTDNSSDSLCEVTRITGE